jgi:NAD(P)-dependent dehydrogenase (short-subunit alcohol dehydrogenase family)
MHNKVSVITGGGSGMGLATAKILGRDSKVVIVGRHKAKLEHAASELGTQGIEVLPFACDLADSESTGMLSAFAAKQGRIGAVIHAAGMSPHMGNANEIMEVNALGTININDAFYPYMESGSCIVDISSMSAYLTPKILMPTKVYPIARKDKDKFMRKMMSRVNIFPAKLRSSVAYGISKNFVIWFAKTDAARFGEKGARVVSVTPGNFETPMGELEKDEASTYLRHCAIKRFGKVEEIAQLLAAVADERMGYLTGADIICDGGCIASGVNPLKRA